MLYVHHGGGQGGAANSLLYLLQHLDDERYAPVVLCNADSPDALDFFRRHGYDAAAAPLSYLPHTTAWWPLYSPRGAAKTARWLLRSRPLAARRFAALLKDLRPDIVHLNSANLVTMAPVAKRRGLPVVLHVREPVSAGTFGLRRLWLERLAANRVDQLIYICMDNRDRFTGPLPQASVIYDPVPFEKYDRTLSRAVARQRLGLAEDARVALFPGGSGLFEIKGIRPFLHAFEILAAKRPDVYAVVPGLRESSGRYLERCAAGARIVAPPFSTEVELYYAACDVVVAPFVVPHFSRAVIEAGAMSKPAVGSRLGGIVEVLEDGTTGLLCAPADAEDLAEKILLLIENPERAKAMGESGYIRARRLFDADEHARAVMAVYDRALEGRR